MMVVVVVAILVTKKGHHFSVGGVSPQGRRAQSGRGGAKESVPSQPKHTRTAAAASRENPVSEKTASLEKEQLF